MRARLILRCATVTGACGAAIMLAGCGLSAGPNEYVVHFAPGTPQSQAELVGKACPGVGKAKLEAPDRNNLASSRAYPVRYDITDASSADKAALTKCLQSFTIVRGVSESNDDA
jgi:hypothetical protein